MPNASKKGKRLTSVFSRLFSSTPKGSSNETRVTTLVQAPTGDEETQSQTSQSQDQWKDYNSILWQQAKKKVKASNEKRWAKITKQFKSQSDDQILSNALESLHTAGVARADAQWTVPVPFGTQTVKVRDTMDKIIGYANQFKEAGAAIAQADPTQHAGLAWGLLGIFVSAAVKNNETHEAIEKHESVARIMCRAAAFAQIYLNDASINVDARQTLQKDLQDLYESVLDWLISAMRFVQQGQVVHYLRAFVGDASIQTGMAAIQKREDEVFKSQRVTELYLHYNTPRNIEVLMERVIQLRERVTIEEKLRLLQWVSQDRYLDRQNAAFALAMQGTGQWLIDHPTLRDWQSSETTQLLWLKGKRGSGMTTAVSIFVDSVSKQIKSSATDVRIVFYYCQKPSKTNKTDFFRGKLYASLLRQMLGSGQSEFPLDLARRYDEEHGAGSVTTDICLKAFTSLIQSHHSNTIIVIDGIDNLLNDRTVALDELKRLAAGLSPKLKILISSPWERDIEAAVQNFTAGFCVLDMDNTEDIENFIEYRVKEDFRLNYLSKDLRPHELNIISGLKDRHGGRFLWVKFSLQSLRRKGSPEVVLERLRRMPEGLNELYTETYAAIKAELDPPDFEIVRLAFMFTLYGNPWVGITTEEVLEAIHKRHPTQDDRERLFNFSSGFLDESLMKKGQAVTDDRCRFSHVYINEFLRLHPDFVETAAQIEIGDLCLSRVATFLDPASQETWKIGDFFCYAVTQWVAHYLEPVIMTMVHEPEPSFLSLAKHMESKLSAKSKLLSKTGTRPAVDLAACITYVERALSVVEREGITRLKILLEDTVSMTSSPSNAFFAAAMWGDAHILDRAEHDSPSAWEQKNVRGLTPMALAEAMGYRAPLLTPAESWPRFLEKMERASQRSGS